jgi:hypothetical protein
MKARLRTRPGSAQTIRMPVLEYFLTVGVALTLGLFVLSVCLGPASPDSAAVARTGNTASMLKAEPHRDSSN